MGKKRIISHIVGLKKSLAECACTKWRNAPNHPNRTLNRTGIDNPGSVRIFNVSRKLARNLLLLYRWVFDFLFALIWTLVIGHKRLPQHPHEAN